MKFKKFFTAFALSSLLVGGALFAVESAKGQKASLAKATDYGTFTFADANDDSTQGFMFGINWTENELPAGWDSTAFAPVDDNSGTFIGDVRKGTEIKKVGPYTYYIPVADAVEGTIATVKGTWSNGSDTFTVNDFSRQWNGSKWVTPVIDLGTFVFDGANSDSTVNNMYGINWDTNDAPAGWETEAFLPVDDNSGTFIGDTRVGAEMKKLGPNTYYIKVTQAEVGSVVTVKGNWANSAYKFAVQEFSLEWDGSKWVTPIIDLGTFTFDGANGDSTINNMYGINWDTNDAPAGWETEAFVPLDDNSGTFIGDTRVGAEMKKLGANTYYIKVTQAEVGSIVTVKGNWGNTHYKFVVNEMSLEWNGNKWATPLIDLGTFTFDGANGDSTINNMYGINWDTNDAPAGWETEAFLPVDDNSGTFIGDTRVGAEMKKLGPYTYYIKVTQAEVGSIVTVKGNWANSTYKFAVQEFSLEWNGNKWATPLIDLGTFVFDGANGDSTINNMYGINWDTNDAPAGWETEAFLAADDNSGTFIGDTRVGAEMKKLGANTYYIKVTGAELWSIVTVKGNWANSTYKFSVSEFSLQWNGSAWIEPTEDLGTIDFIGAQSDSLAAYIFGINEVENDAPAGWDSTAFAPVNEESGVFVEGTRVGTEIKKVTASGYFIATPGTDVGTVATIKGTWSNGAYRFVAKEVSFQWDGAKWNKVLPNFEAADFAKILLIETMDICDGVGSVNNHDALASVWEELSFNYYKYLTIAEKTILTNAVADKSIVVPADEDGINDMLPEEAVAAAMYRYDYCTSKYSLTSFIDGRPAVPNQSSYNNSLSANQSNSVILITTIAVLSVVALSLLTVIVIKKRKED